MERQKYTIAIYTYQQGTNIISNCSDITFINVGTTNCVINNQFLLTAGQSLSITAQFNEIDVTQYRVDFPSTTPQNNKLQVIKKIFV